MVKTLIFLDRPFLRHHHWRQVPLIVTSRQKQEAKYYSICSLWPCWVGPIGNKGFSDGKKKIILSVWWKTGRSPLAFTPLFGEENCNIGSLAVGSTERPGISRMTIILDVRPESGRCRSGPLNRITSLVKVKRIDDDASVLMELARSWLTRRMKEN